MIGFQTISGHDLAELLSGRDESDDVVVVDGVPNASSVAAATRGETASSVIVGRDGWRDAHPSVVDLVDVVVDDDDALTAIAATVAHVPLASATLATLLRGHPRSVDDGLVAESVAYSTLQGWPEFERWRADTPIRDRPVPIGPAVVVTREGNELHIELARPEVRNALGVQMRDDLLEALAIAEADPDLRVTLTGQGPSFCAGGDLDEFGTFPDPTTAHRIRLERSIGAVLHRLRDRVTVHLHGACYGSGIELPAFAGHVVAAPDTTIALPELGLGLIPGAGGTVSLPPRIGRHATAWLALTRLPIDAATALRWGLVDGLV